MILANGPTGKHTARLRDYLWRSLYDRLFDSDLHGRTMMGKAEELRKKADEKKAAEEKERERQEEENRKLFERRAKNVVPTMFRTCMDKCEQEATKGFTEAALNFSGYDAQQAATAVVGKLVKEGFSVKTRNYVAGFRMDGEGNTLSSGEPFVAFEISWDCA